MLTPEVLALAVNPTEGETAEICPPNQISLQHQLPVALHKRGALETEELSKTSWMLKTKKEIMLSTHSHVPPFSHDGTGSLTPSLSHFIQPSIQ